MGQRFHDRADGGQALAAELAGRYTGRMDVVVLALPRGGVLVGYEVARALGAPLDVFIVRKLGLPAYEQLAMGAISSGGVRVMNPYVLETYPVGEAEIETVVALRALEPARIVVAVPVAAPETCDKFRDEVDEVVCLLTPDRFMGVGRWYEDFSQTTDDEVRELLARAAF